MISRPSSLFIVIIDTLSPSAKVSDKSLCSPLTDIATASLANPGPIKAAKSFPLLSFGRSFPLPSGKLTTIFPILSFH